MDKSIATIRRKVNAARYHVQGRVKREIPIYIFCHHKTGTNLLRKIFIDICARERWKFTSVRYLVDEPPDGDVVVFSHSNIDVENIKPPYVGVHMIRDPREVVVSGYLYHLRTDEPWCISKNFEMKGGRECFPVPEFRQHMNEEWKKNYLQMLGGMSYQEKLNSMPKDEGLEFEMKYYSSWTIGDMLAWKYDNPNVVEVKMEDASFDYDTLFSSIFSHLQFSENKIAEYMGIAGRHDLNRLGDKAVKKISHVRTRESKTWVSHLSKDNLNLFYKLYGNDVFSKLGYS